MTHRSVTNREALGVCLFLSLAMFFVQVEAQNGVVFFTGPQRAKAAPTDQMNARDIIELAVSRGLTTKDSAAEIVDALSFDRVFTFMSTDEVISALRRDSLLTTSQSNTAIVSQMQSKGIAVNTLRPDGVITAMATLTGGPLLVQKSGHQLWNIATDAKDTLRQSYERDQFAFLDLFSPMRLLTLLDDRIMLTSTQHKDWFAFSTQAVPSGATSLIDKANVKDGQTAAQLKTITDKQPVGRRMAQIVNYQINPTWNEGLNPPLYEADGSIAKDTKGGNLYTLWLDDWESAMKTKMQTFFTEYKNIGGQLDTVSIDIEIDWLGMYFARNIWFAGKENLVMNDPRWPALEQDMRDAGITDFSSLKDWFGRKDYRAVIWDSVMERRQAAAYNRAIFEPIRALYPNVKFTNYEYYNRSQTVPYGDYRKYPRSEYGVGTIQGTHQSVNLYDDGIVTERKDGIIDQPTDANPSSFERFIEDVKGTRTMAAASTVPIMPWIAHPDYAEARKSAPDHVYYPEMIFHTGLNGVDQYLLWVWSELSGLIPADRWTNGMRTVDASLKELSSVAGYANNRTLSFTQVDYQDDFVLTGMEGGGKRIWRLTPRPTVSTSIVSSSPAVFQINGKRVSFSNQSAIKVVPNTVSNKGYWIEETQGPTMLTKPAAEVLTLLNTPLPSSSSASSAVTPASSSSSRPPSSSASSQPPVASSSRSSSVVASTPASSASSSLKSSAQLVTDTPRELNEVERLRLERSERLVDYALGGGNAETSLHPSAPEEAPTASVKGFIRPLIVKKSFASLTQTDVPRGTQMEKDVALLFDRGIIGGQGNDATKFNLGSGTNRAEVVTMIGRMFMIPIKEFAKQPFQDVATGAWYRDAIHAALGVGLVRGYPDGKFRPEKTINVAEMLKLATIMTGFATDEDGAKAKVWYEPYVNAAKTNGLLKGITLPPLDSNATRGWIMQLLANAERMRK